MGAIGVQPGGHLRRANLVLLVSEGKCRGDPAQRRFVAAAVRAGCADDIGGVSPGARPSRARVASAAAASRAVCCKHRLKAPRLAGEGVEDLAEAGFTEVSGNTGQGFGQRAAGAAGLLKHLIKGPLPKLARVAFVHRLGVRGNPGLEGKAAEQ